MIQLKDIKIKDKMIVCTAFVEDCTEPFEIRVNVESEELEPVILPHGYEWCKSHVAHAKFALLDMLESGEIKKQTTVAWY